MVDPRICAVVTATNLDQAIDSIRCVTIHEPELIELRFDYMEYIEDLNGIREATDTPLIATNRRRDQGGLSNCLESERVAALLNACEAGFDFVDLELTTGSIIDVAHEVKARGVKLIISHHDLSGTPKRDDLDKILNEEQNLGADICKIVGTSSSLSDNMIYLSFMGENQGTSLVCFGMGEAGVMSRVFSPLFGGAFTYASAGPGMESAPGQLTIADLKEIYRLLGF